MIDERAIDAMKIYVEDKLLICKGARNCTFDCDHKVPHKGNMGCLCPMLIAGCVTLKKSEVF